MTDELARAAGIAESYADFFGNERRVSTETKRAILQAMGYDASTDRAARRTVRELRAQRRSHVPEPVYVIPADTPVKLPWGTQVFEPGYHSYGAGSAQTTVIAAPPQAYVPPAIDNSGLWGFALQLYSLTSRRNWGMGDLGDLARFVAVALEAGAQIVALNPLHQLHVTNPASASPYSPSSRLHLNVLYIDVPGAVAALDLPPATAQPDEGVHRLQACELVDYPSVACAKLGAFARMHAAFAALDAQDARVQAFLAFKRAGGEPLRRMAIYESLTAHFKRIDPQSYGWMQWPAAYRDPHSRAVAEYAERNAGEIAFHCFLQWIAESQLAAAAAAAGAMAVGLYRDLAVGVDANGLDVWSDREAFCSGLSVGAPPDELNAEGQNWGLPPLNPRILRQRAYAPFANVLRANMRHAGALRIDHVMGLRRLFCIPAGAHASEGAYVDFPFDDLTGVLTLESCLNRCAIVGEDLGTVPAGFREHMAARRIFSCRLLYFEREAGGSFRDPAAYPHDAVASTGTHDLPPLLGYWRNLAADDRACLQAFLNGAGSGSDLDLVSATYRALGRAKAGAVVLQMEDALLQSLPVNVPGTTTGMPNWRRKLAVKVEDLKDDVRFTTIAGALRDARTGAMK